MRRFVCGLFAIIGLLCVVFPGQITAGLPYATGSVDFLNDETLDVDKAASFLCADCLNEILPQKVSRYFGVGAIHLGTKKIRVFEENFAGFGLGDFYFDCNLMERKNSDSNQMDILIFYCPIRYEETP